MSDPFHPDLRFAARLIPQFSFPRRLLPFMPVLRMLPRVLPSRAPKGVTVENVMIPGPDRAPQVRVRVYRPAISATSLPALLWIHGGGFIMGAPEQDDRLCGSNAADLGALIVSVDYRLAPQAPFPAPLEDCYSALKWLYNNASDLGVQRERIAIGGASAGGGLAASLAQIALDRGEVRPVFQVLIYPMLDDRTATRTNIDQRHLRLWTQESNVVGWSAYLGQPPGGESAPEYAVPARRTDLTGLPPAWLGVGTCDLFHDEDLEYVGRLEQASVPCETVVVDGAFHGFDIVSHRQPVVREFRASYLAALRKALFD